MEEIINFDGYVSHPFKKMNIGDVVCVSKKLQRYVHSYGFISGKKFSTRSKGSELYVKRIS